MKTIVLLITILFTPICHADGLWVSWEHDGINVKGFTIYVWKTVNTDVIYRFDVLNPSNRTKYIGSASKFSAAPSYSAIVFAYNEFGSSEESNEAIYIPPGYLIEKYNFIGRGH